MKKTAVAIFAVGAVLLLAGCPAHDGMTTQQTINYHCEKNDHGARWLAGYGDGSSQLNNLEEEQHRLTSTPDDRCYGAFTRIDGARVIIGYDVNYYNEKIVRVWIAAIVPAGSFSATTTYSGPNPGAAQGTVGWIGCYDTTDQQKADAAAAGITLPPDCFAQLASMPGGGQAETVAQFLALDPETA